MKSTNREVLDLALPAIGGGLIGLGYHWLNWYWVGKLGATSVTAVAVAMFAAWAFLSLAQLTSSGAAALVARYVGAGKEAAARYSASQGLRWSWALAAATAAAGIALAPQVYAIANTSGEAALIGVPYVRIAFGLGAGQMTQIACEAVFRARGDTRTPFVLGACGLVVNGCLDPLLVFGWGPVPALGVPGAAIATVIATSGVALASFLFLRRRGCLASTRPSDEELRLDATTPLPRGPLPLLDLSMGRRLARVGLPVAGTGVVFVAIYFLLSRVVTDAGGDAAEAGLGVGLRGEQVAFVLGSGFAAAASSLVGRRLGAGLPDLAARSAWRSTLLCAALCAAWSLALLAFGRPIASLFLDAGAARDHAVAYFTIVSWCLVPQCFEVVLDGAFAGAGLTLPPMVISILISAVRIPLARWAAFDGGLGVAGIWWTIAATAALRGVVVAVWFARGTWKTRSV